jgi:hypothetical protein
MSGKRSWCGGLPPGRRKPRGLHRTVARGDGQEVGRVMASPEHALYDYGATRPLSTSLGRGNSGITKGRCAERPLYR